MAAFNYRFSIIPPGAITDPRVTPRALQVLCLLGRHIDNDGWCTRSQVRMAKELGCSRSAVQQACDILFDAGWIEKQRNGRGGTGPDSSEQPFAALSYRVRIDRSDLPAKGAPAAAEPPIEADAEAGGGASQVAGGASPLAGGATMLAPLEGISSKGISLEGERATAAKADEEFGRWLATFLKAWPTAAADDQARIASAGRQLDKTQRKAALDRIQAYLAHLKLIKRTHIPAGWRYLEQRAWEALPDGADRDAAPGAAQSAAEGSDQFAIWKAVWKIARPRAGIPQFRLTGAFGQRQLAIARELPAAMIWIADSQRAWRDVEQGTQQFAAWRRWLGELMPANMIEQRGGVGVQLLGVPSPWPPRVDGTASPGNDWPPDEVSSEHQPESDHE